MENDKIIILSGKLGKLLNDRGLDIATAESCTAGGIGAAIASVDGSSSYFLGGTIAYSENVKVKVLGVNPETIAKHGVVSPETAAGMNEGVRRITGADMAISITGYIGASGGDAFAPNGTVCICVARNGQEAVHKRLNLADDRYSNLREAVIKALETAVEYLENKDAFIVQGHIVDVIAKKIFDGEVTVSEGRIKSITEKPVAVDAPYIMPGFVDAHVHIESSMMLPENFAREALRHGTIAAVCDSHEIANVLGIDGVNFMIENSRKVPFHFHFGAPSCVPCTDRETSGANLGPADVARMLDNPDIHFLSEMMFYMGVVLDIPLVMDKIKAARDRNMLIDGHAPGLCGEDLRKYIAAGISTDHECAEYK